MSFYPILWPFILASLIFLGLGAYALRYRRTEAGQAFLFLVLCGWIWAGGFIFEIAADELNAKLFLAGVQFLGITLISLAQLKVVVAFLGKSWPKRVWFFLLAVPALTNLVIWTNPLHHWFWGAPEILRDVSPFPVLHSDYQIWFYAVHAPMGYACTLAALVLLIRAIPTLYGDHRFQAVLLLIAAVIPTLTDLLYVIGITPVQSFNFTSSVFSLSGILIALALFRFRFLDLLPLAREYVFDNMTEGVIVLDDHKRIVDINPAARVILAVPAPPIGCRIDDIQADLSHSIEQLLRENQSQTDIELRVSIPRHYDLRIAVVRERRGTGIGHVITLRDITERVRLYRKVEDLAIRDSLTCALNRRRFLELSRAELQLMRRDGLRPLAVVMVDIDGFKQVNDTFGHAMGDKVLVILAEEIQSLLRESDLLGRIGGDEFAMLLPNVSAPDALHITNRVCQGIDSLRFSSIAEEIRISACVGVITVNPADPILTIEELLDRADKALYTAKKAGRGQVIVVS